MTVSFPPAIMISLDRGRFAVVHSPLIFAPLTSPQIIKVENTANYLPLGRYRKLIQTKFDGGVA